MWTTRGCSVSLHSQKVRNLGTIFIQILPAKWRKRKSMGATKQPKKSHSRVCYNNEFNHLSERERLYGAGIKRRTTDCICDSCAMRSVRLQYEVFGPWRLRRNPSPASPKLCPGRSSFVAGCGFAILDGRPARADGALRCLRGRKTSAADAWYCAHFIADRFA
jgi:hypothetical protein